MSEAEEICQICDGMGMRIVRQPDGRQAAEPCECQHERRIRNRINRAGIPARYAGCSLENFKHSGGDPSLFLAYNTARRFVEIYPGEGDGVGLLFTGTIGTGKTHLATAVLQKLVGEKGVSGLFCDYRELLKQITNSYNSRVETTELEVLRPVFEAEVLLLDEVGAAKSTDWVFDTVAHILNTRYNDKRTTLLTTNYPNLASGAGATLGNDAVSLARSVTREETLGDRIGERMRSRLHEMCVPVEMKGADYRQTGKRARFA